MVVQTPQEEPEPFILPEAIRLLEYLLDTYDEDIGIIDQIDIENFLNRYYKVYRRHDGN